MNMLGYAEPLACLVVLVILLVQKQAKAFKLLTGFLLVRTFTCVAWLLLSYLTKIAAYGLNYRESYRVYFYIYWPSYAIEAVLTFGLIYSLYKMAMEPLPGLQRLGVLMFRWAGAIAILLAVSIAVGPHAAHVSFVARFVGQLQQTQSVLTLCMLLFVTLASKPMGLCSRSKIVGVSLGLGVLAATNLIMASWMPLTRMPSAINILNGVSILFALAIWGTYFVLPEPKRRMIVLPTTSPFLRWNQISQVLGDEPGFVVLGQMTPDMFAPAEVEIMRRAAAKMPPRHLAAG